MTRRLGLVVALAAAILASLAPTVAPSAAAAVPDLSFTTETRYDVDPANARIHVTVSLTAVNHLKDTKTRLYYFDRAFLAVQPGVQNLAISARTGSPKVRVSSAKADHTMLQIDFGGRLPAGSTRTFTLTFDLVDAGGDPTRQLRIGSSLVTFPVWAFASEATPGGSVTVTFPPGYQIELQAGAMGDPTVDATGRTVYTSGTLADPLGFFAYFVADRPNAYIQTSRATQVDGKSLDITMRAWPDDPAWAERVGGLLERGVPALSEQIGLPWVADRPLVVAEANSRSTAGYSGKFDPENGRIEVAYYADSLVVLHEAAHAWFNGNLVAERWVNEGFASWYARQAAAALEEAVPAAIELTPELSAARIPLNEWGPVGSNEAAAEDYAYAASDELARLIAERAGPAALGSVWEAARRGTPAYEPVLPDGPLNEMGMPGGAIPAREVATAPPDWRSLLDLLEDRTGKKYDDLWRAWVVRHEEAGLLDQRASARRQYADVVARAGDWQLPALVRQAMRAWQFDQATELLDAADRALDDRDAVMSAAADAGLAVPRALETTFEGPNGFAAAASEADAELITIEAFVTARAARPSKPGFVEQVGLWWTTPEVDLATASDAFASGDLRASVEASASARLAWEGATDTGRTRLMTMLAAALVALVLVASVVGWVRGLRDRRHRRRLMAHPLTRTGKGRSEPSR
jgi:hypothetical protein